MLYVNQSWSCGVLVHMVLIFCEKEALFEAKVVHYNMDSCWRWNLLRGGICFLLFTSAIHCWNYGPLGGVHGVPHTML